MMRLFIIVFIQFFFSVANARDIGETEITTEDGIEVFQKEKYYLLKKNVQILSDDFDLTADNVKIYFDKDMYDIVELDGKKNVNFNSKKFNISGKGENLNFDIKNQIIFVSGFRSNLFFKNLKMLSDGQISVDNMLGTFFINGPNSNLVSDTVHIDAKKISGDFQMLNNERNISNLIVEDKNKLKIKTDDILMYSKKAIFNNEKSIIELFEDVSIIRGKETITGDFGIFNTAKNSYKVSSKNSKKVKVIIGSNE